MSGLGRSELFDIRGVIHRADGHNGTSRIAPAYNIGNSIRMNEHIDWNLLGRYFAGEASEEEESSVSAWMEIDSERARTVEDLRQICELARAVPQRFDVTAAWEKVNQKTTQEERGAKYVDRPPVQSRKKRLSPIYRIIGLLLIVGIAVVLLVPERQAEGPAAPTERVYATKRGQRATINLVDGTSVSLNVESKITIPVTFATEIREVHVEGEAFFKVAPDANRPFLVHTGNAIVEVLGTEFNVRSIGGRKSVQVVVAEGKVSLRERRQAQESATVLNRADMGLLSNGGGVSVKRNVSLSSYLSWTEGRLSFDKTPLTEVFQELERWYDLEIRLSEGVAGESLLTATFTDEPLREILNVVAESMKLRYEVNGRIVIVYPADKAVEVDSPDTQR